MVTKIALEYLKLNPFLLTVACLQLGGAYTYLSRGNWKMALVTLFYSLCNFVFVSIK
jgi:uncharacterized membrane protein YjjP (DUF1212 family)